MLFQLLSYVVSFSRMRNLRGKGKVEAQIVAMESFRRPQSRLQVLRRASKCLLDRRHLIVSPTGKYLGLRR